MLKKIFFICVGFLLIDLLPGCFAFDTNYTPGQGKLSVNIADSQKIPVSFSVNSNVGNIGNEVRDSLSATNLFSMISYYSNVSSEGLHLEYNVYYRNTRGAMNDLLLCTTGGILHSAALNGLDVSVNVFYDGKHIVGFGHAEKEIELVGLLLLPPYLLQVVAFDQLGGITIIKKVDVATNDVVRFLLASPEAQNLGLQISDGVPTTR